MISSMGRANGEMDRGGGGGVTAMSFLISEFSLAFSPLPTIIRADTDL